MELLNGPPGSRRSRVDVRTVAGRLGHSNASITLNTYAHYVRSADEAAAEKMGEVLADG